MVLVKVKVKVKIKVKVRVTVRVVRVRVKSCEINLFSSEPRPPYETLKTLLQVHMIVEAGFEYRPAYVKNLKNLRSTELKSRPVLLSTGTLTQSDLDVVTGHLRIQDCKKVIETQDRMNVTIIVAKMQNKAVLPPPPPTSLREKGWF
jgi:hypothetical protein